MVLRSSMKANMIILSLKKAEKGKDDISNQEGIFVTHLFSDLNSHLRMDLSLFTNTISSSFRRDLV